MSASGADYGDQELNFAQRYSFSVNPGVTTNVGCLLRAPFMQKTFDVYGGSAVTVPLMDWDAKYDGIYLHNVVMCPFDACSNCIQALFNE